MVKRLKKRDTRKVRLKITYLQSSEYFCPLGKQGPIKIRNAVLVRVPLNFA